MSDSRAPVSPAPRTGRSPVPRRVRAARLGAVEDVRRHARAAGRLDRHPRRRDPRADGPERLGQVDADQGAGRLPPARPGAAGRARRRARSTSGTSVPDGLRFVHQDLGLVLELSAQDNLALHGGFAKGVRRPRPVARAGAGDAPAARALRRRPRHPPPAGRGDAGRAHGRRDRRGAPGLARRRRACSCSTSRPRCCRTTRSSACSRSSARCASAGTSVLYVSHRLDEIFELADRVTVLRGGRVVATRAVAGRSIRAALASLMVGEDVDPDYRAPVAGAARTRRSCSRRATSRGRWLRGVDLDVHRGEILGIAGLAGAGVLELPYVIAGHAPEHQVTGELRLPSGSDDVARRRATPRTSTSRSSRRTAQREGVDRRVRASARTSRCRSSAGSAAAAGSALRAEREVVERVEPAARRS